MQSNEGELRLAIVESEKDLGVIIDKSLSFGETSVAKFQLQIEIWG